MMKRLCLISSVTAIAALSLPATADAEPAILYIPTEEVMLTPSGMEACMGVSMSDYNSGLGCVPGLDAAGTRAAYAGAADITTAMETALADFDVMVTNTRPVDYLPYYMLLVSDMEATESESFTCTGSPVNCGSRSRNTVSFVNGGTMNCSDPDDVQASLYAFGNAAGLEAKVPSMDMMADPDPMDYRADAGPDYSVGATAYQDRCDERAMPLGGEENTPQMPTCTSADHAMCETTGQANSYQDLLQYFGARTMDMDAPVITVEAPAADSVVPEGGDLEVRFSVEDADMIVGVRVTVMSPALMDAAGTDTITACTNNQCDFDYLEGNPFRPSNEPFNDFTLSGPLPGGDYTVTFEASDYHGNVAEMQTVNVTVEGGPVGGSDSDSDSDGSDSSSDSDSAGSGITGDGGSSGDDTDDGSTGDTAGGDDDDSGCSCSTHSAPGFGGASLMLLGLLGLRRRW